MGKILSNTWTAAKSVAVLVWRFAKYLISLILGIVVIIVSAILFVTTLGKVDLFNKKGKNNAVAPKKAQEGHNQ